MKALRVLVLGGYGHFGARIVRALSDSPDIHVIAAGRHPDTARTVLAPDVLGRITLARVEIEAPDLIAQLAATGAQLVVHTAGPFQGQGQGYRVAHSLAAGRHALHRPGRRS